jgi:hypothetical protein
MSPTTDFSIAAILGWQPSCSIAISTSVPTSPSSRKSAEPIFTPWTSHLSKNELNDSDVSDASDQSLDRVISSEAELSEVHRFRDDEMKLRDIEVVEDYDMLGLEGHNMDENILIANTTRDETDSSEHSSSSCCSTTPTTQPRHHPSWTQRQRRNHISGGGGGLGGGLGRRPYSRGCVLALSWWYAHLPYLATAEMEALGRLTALSRHQIKVWWQNRRHSQRNRAVRRQRRPTIHNASHRNENLSLLDTNDGMTALSLPQAFSGQRSSQQLPPPQSGQRCQLFSYLLQFFCAYVLPRLPPLTPISTGSPSLFCSLP